MKRIVVVDDDPDVLTSIKMTLNDEYEIIGVQSGFELFKYLNREEIPDLILLDIMMPEMNGINVFNILIKDISWKHIPLIFLSAITDRQIKSTYKLLSNGFIEKPFSPEDLKNTINKCLNKQE